MLYKLLISCNGIQDMTLYITPGGTLGSTTAGAGGRVEVREFRGYYLIYSCPPSGRITFHAN